MSLYEIPAEIFRDLLLNVEVEISSASPFAFLLTEQVDGKLDPHLKWLAKSKLLKSPAEQDGRVAILDSLRSSLDIISRPVRRIIISEITEDGPRRSVHVSDGYQVVVAMFNEKDCIVSDPVDLEEFREAVLKDLRPPAKSKATPIPRRLHPVQLDFLGGLAAAWIDRSEAEAADQVESYPALDWPIERTVGEQRLGALLDDLDDGAAALDSLVEAQLLQEENGKLSIHPGFKLLNDAITSSDFMEIQRLEYPNSSLGEIQPLVRAYFTGPKGARCLIWPVDGKTGEVVLSQPTADELQKFVNYLVGYLDPEEQG